MQFTSFAAAAVMAFLPATMAADCNCIANSDGGRWIDQHSPADAIRQEIRPGEVSCYKATVQGNMCLTGTDFNDYICLHEFAVARQKYDHGKGDWFLPTQITCGSVRLLITG